MTSTVPARGYALAMALAWGALLACGEPPPPAVPGNEPPPAAPPETDSTARVSAVEVPGLPGAITLYDPGRWRATNGGSFSVFEHAPSHSTLALRVWRAARLVRPAECEAEARLVRPTLPRADPDTLIDSRPLEAPDGFSGTLVVGVEPTPNGTTGGFVLGVGATVARCFVLAFETTAEGVGAPRTVGDRLRAVADRIAPSVTLRYVDERVQPERELR